MVDNSLIPKLRTDINSPSWEVRRQAVLTLYEFRNTKTTYVAANIICQAANDPNDLVRQAARDSLVTMGDAGIKTLVKMLYCNDFAHGDDEFAWKIALALLPRIGIPAMERLLIAVATGDNCVRFFGFHLLGDISDGSPDRFYAILAANLSLFNELVAVIADIRKIPLKQQLEELTETSDQVLREKASKALQIITEEKSASNVENKDNSSRT